MNKNKIFFIPDNFFFFQTKVKLNNPRDNSYTSEIECKNID